LLWHIYHNKYWIFLNFSPYDKWFGIQCAIFWISQAASGRLFFGKGDGSDGIQAKLIVKVDELEISIIEFDLATHVACNDET